MIYNQFRKIVCVFIPALIITFLCGCATIYNPATGKKEIIFIPTSTEQTIGRQTAAQIAKEFKFVKDPIALRRIREIGKKIAAVSDRKDLQYSFYVIDDKNINAFTIPGGYVYVNSGLMDKATDSELACVLGHEIGHVAAKHIIKKMQSQIGYSLLMNIAARSADISDIQTAVSITYDLVSKGYSREDELEADRIGVKYAYKAGYDPHAMIRFLKKMQAEEKGNRGLVFLRTHPYPEQRMQQLQQYIPLMLNQKTQDNIQDSAENDKVSGSEKDKPVLNKSSVITSKPVEESETNPRPGRVMCSECKKVFPGRTNYCPYDGIKL